MIGQLLQLAISGAAMYLALRAFALRTVPKVKYYILLAVCAFFYSYGYFLELGASQVESAYLAQCVQYLGVAFYAACYYLFIREYGDRPVQGKWRAGALFVFPAIVVILVNAYPAVTVYFKGMTFVQEPVAYLRIERGWVFHLHVLYSMVLLYMSTAEVIRHYPKTGAQDRKKRRMFVLATLVPGIAIVFFAFDVMPGDMQLGSSSLVIALSVLGYHILHHCVQDWLPYARETILENLGDGYVLLDSENRYIDANAVALEYFPALTAVPAGTPLEQIDGLPNDLLEGEDGTEVQVVTPSGQRVLRASHSTISYGDETICTSVLFYDVTQLHSLMGEMEELASHDSLTGLYNRGMFFKLAYRDFDLHRRMKENASVMMLDIDHFKVVNDLYGHPTGDRVLVRVSALLQERLRHTDVGGRYGGEEFCVFLPATDAQGAYKIATEIRRQVERQQFYYGSRTFAVTISIGITQLDHQRHTQLEELIAEADAAMYRAKETGRNKVCLFGDAKPRETPKKDRPQLVLQKRDRN